MALALFALVSLLAGVQAGDIQLADLLPAGKPAGSKASKNESPLLLARSADETSAEATIDSPEEEMETAAELAIVPEGAVRIDGQTRQLVCRAVGLMDPALAAERVAQLNDNDATLVLSCQERRRLAYILEMAEPQDAANWLNILLQVDGSVAGLPPGESILDQVNDEIPLEDGLEQEPAADPLENASALLPDYMLSPEERREFLAEFPQYAADNLTTQIPAISH